MTTLEDMTRAELEEYLDGLETVEEYTEMARGMTAYWAAMSGTTDAQTALERTGKLIQSWAIAVADEERNEIIREVERRCYNGAPDPGQTLYDYGINALMGEVVMARMIKENPF